MNMNKVTTHLPFHIGDKVGQVGAVQGIEQVHLVSIVSPGAEGKVTLLHIKGEEGHIDRAGAFSDGWLVPHHLAIITKNHIGLHGAGELIICTVVEKMLYRERRNTGSHVGM